MKRINHTRRRLIALMLIAITAMISGASYGQNDQPSFVIGVLDLPDGPITRGALLATREINEGGGVRGADGTFFRLELFVEPIEDGEILTQAVDNLANEGVIAVLGPETTEAVLSNLPILQSLGVPILTPAIGDTVVASDTTGNIFRIRAAERWLGSALADHIVQTLQFSTITTVQLDRTSTAARVGFSIALDQLQGAPARNVPVVGGSGRTRVHGRTDLADADACGGGLWRTGLGIGLLVPTSKRRMDRSVYLPSRRRTGL